MDDYTAKIIEENCQQAQAEDRFEINRGQGFRVQLNGVAVSVQFGAFHYCANRDHSNHAAVDEIPDYNSCRNAEVAVLNTDGRWLTQTVWRHLFGEELGDDVAADVTPDQVIQVLSYVRETYGSQKGEVDDDQLSLGV